MASTRSVREHIADVLRRELMGPGQPDEVLTEYPTTRYIVGRLAPAESRIDESENDSFELGNDDEEAGAQEFQPPLVIGFHPSSMGVSFLLDEGSTEIRVEVSWADYRHEKPDTGPSEWRRVEQRGVVDGLALTQDGTIGPIVLSNTFRSNPSGVTISGVDDPKIRLEGVVRSVDARRAVSLFLVNRRAKGEESDRTKDERWLFQPALRVTAPDGSAVFVSKSAAREGENDSETAGNDLLYRHASEFATGHGVAVSWTNQTTESKELPVSSRSAFPHSRFRSSSRRVRRVAEPTST